MAEPPPASNINVGAINVPSELSWTGCMADNWSFFRQKFEIFMLASGNDEKPAKIKTALLLSCIGDRALKLYNTFGLDESSKNDLAKVLKKFEEHFNPEKNVTYERYKFFTRNQKINESYEDYIVELRDLSSTCEFGALTESLIKDRLVYGINDVTVKDRLLRAKNLTLSAASEICRTSQNTKLQVEDICSSSNSMSSHIEFCESSKIDKVNRRSMSTQNQSQVYPNTTGSNRHVGNNGTSNEKRQMASTGMGQQRMFSCGKCGYKHILNKCPAFNKKCMKCNKYNHFASQCRHYIREIDEEFSEDINTVFLGEVSQKCEPKNEKNDWTITVGVNNNPLDLKVDTGAQANVMNAACLNEIGLDKNNLLEGKVRLTTYTGQTIRCIGKCVIPLKFKGSVYNLEFFVVDSTSSANIIGLRSAIELKLVNPLCKVNLTDCVFQEYEDLFQGLGCMNEEYDIKIKDNVSPVVHACRKIPLAIQPRLKQKLDELEQLGVVCKIPWSGGGERIYAAVGGACLIHRAGELSVVEYGLDKVLHTVRTERVNPHVLSVRINEGAGAGGAERKHLAYLLDRQTIAVVDLITGVQLGQWWHEARVDWLELNESGRLLLLRDTRRRLLLLSLHTGDKEIIASGVGFVQWIENSDAVVAQTPTHLLIWYSAWDPGSVEMAECGGGAAVEVTARRVLFEGGQLPHLQLDEHRLAFNNALRIGDLAGCASYLGGVGNSADVAPLWRQLAGRALADDDIQLAGKCYREVGDEARTYYLDKTVEMAAAEGDGDVTAGLNSPVVKARLAIFAGDLATAEECYVKRANRPDLAISMYKQFNKWTDAIVLAEKTDRASVMSLKQQHMDYLTSTGRLGEAGAVLASTGDVQGAVRLWLKGGRARRAASLLLQHPQMLRDNELVDAVHTQLIQEEWWEMAGELSERKGETMAAVEYYARGNNYARAVQLAREACPSEVTRLEGMWGGWLVASRQAGAAVPHLIEAGETRAALAAAIKAHHYKRALQIVQVIEDKESIREECEQLGEHFISTQEWETAERVLSSCGMAERCVCSYNAAGRVADGLRLAAAQLTEEQTRDIYLPLALTLRQEGQLRKAEQIYIGLGEADQAITMYKEATQYEAMLRLVAAHRSSLLEATRRHIAQALHASGDLRAAENYYIQAGDWKSAIQMYRSAGQWEGAERVARAHAPSSVQQQVALQWAAALGGAPAARLLAARGLAALGARWALQAQRWDIAMELSELGGGITKREVTRHEAAALAEEQPEEAEAAFLRAGAYEDAVRMWMTRGHHQRALQLAEQHAEHMVEETLVEGARAAAERGDLTQFETLMIRANRPREVVQHYKDLELWEEASRVSREYLPDSAEPVPPSVPPLLQRAADHADRGEWSEAVELLINASAAGANGGATRLAERAALRAARLARDHLQGAARRRAADMLADRFSAIGQSDVGEQLRSALSEGYYGGDDDAIGASMEYGEDEAGAAPHVSPAEVEAEAEGLERLARAGHWQRCLAHSGPKAKYYALRYAAHLFKANQRIEGVDIESEEVPEALSQALDTLRQYLVSDSAAGLSSSAAPLARSVCSEILVRMSLAPKAYSVMKDAAAVLLAAGADDRSLQAITLLMALHVPQIASRAARSLPRYTDIMVADVVYYACGAAVRAEGAGSAREAFVLLNRSLDLAEAADDDAAHLLDYTDFECTDWARAPLLLESACVRGPALGEVREWVLSVSMDQAVEQTLPVDSRGLYSSSVGAEEACCVLTGYPLGSRLVTFINGRCANREWWSRAVSAARGGGAPAGLLAHVGQWCGPADYSQI